MERNDPGVEKGNRSPRSSGRSGQKPWAVVQPSFMTSARGFAARRLAGPSCRKQRRAVVPFCSGPPAFPTGVRLDQSQAPHHRLGQAGCRAHRHRHRGGRRSRAGSPWRKDRRSRRKAAAPAPLSCEWRKSLLRSRTELLLSIKKARPVSGRAGLPPGDFNRGFSPEPPASGLRGKAGAASRYHWPGLCEPARRHHCGDVVEYQWVMTESYRTERNSSMTARPPEAS